MPCDPRLSAAGHRCYRCGLPLVSPGTGGLFAAYPPVTRPGLYAEDLRGDPSAWYYECGDCLRRQHQIRLDYLRGLGRCAYRVLGGFEPIDAMRELPPAEAPAPRERDWTYYGPDRELDAWPCYAHLDSAGRECTIRERRDYL